MRDYGDSRQQASSQPSSQSQVLPLDQFLQRVKQLRSDIDSLSGSIDYIGQLHQRTLSSTDSQAKDQLEHYVSQTQIQTTAIKDGIKGLERDLANTTDNHRNTKNTQLQSLKTYFKSELAKYQSVEHEYQQKYSQQIRRQYEIVYPDATEQEIQQAMESNYGGEGVFQSAVSLILLLLLLLLLHHPCLSRSHIIADNCISSRITAPVTLHPYSATSGLVTTNCSASNRRFLSWLFSIRNSPPWSSSRNPSSRQPRRTRSRPLTT